MNSDLKQQEYSSKIVTDLSVDYQLTGVLNMTIKLDKLSDICPDNVIEENKNGGGFDWSRNHQ